MYPPINLAAHLHLAVHYRYRITWCAADVEGWSPDGGFSLLPNAGDSVTDGLRHTDRIRNIVARCTQPRGLNALTRLLSQILWPLRPQRLTPGTATVRIPNLQHVLGLRLSALLPILDKRPGGCYPHDPLCVQLDLSGDLTMVSFGLGGWA